MFILCKFRCMRFTVLQWLDVDKHLKVQLNVRPHRETFKKPQTTKPIFNLLIFAMPQSKIKIYQS